MVEFGAREQMTGSTASGSQSFVVVFLDGVFQQRITRVEQTNSLQVSQTCYSAIRLAPSAGSHTVEFKQFRVNANGQIGPGFARVSKIVQATQWPAVTTGTIICTSSTRPAAPFEGQTIYETDTDLSLTWSGSAWVQTGSLGAWTTWTPTITQVGSVTHSVVYGRYTKIGRTVYANFTTNVTGSGSAGTGVSISLPVTSAAGSPLRLGSGHIYDTSTATRYTGMCELDSTTAFRIVGDWSSGNQWGGIPSVGLASGDQVSASITYEAAS